MSDLISREALKKMFEEGCAGECDCCSHKKDGNCGLIDNAPTIEEQPKGKWKLVEHGKDIDLECPFCGYKRGNLSYGYTMAEVLKDIAEDDTILTKFCEMCGADLRGEEE